MLSSGRCSGESGWVRVALGSNDFAGLGRKISAEPGARKLCRVRGLRSAALPCDIDGSRVGLKAQSAVRGWNGFRPS